jgi:hypothetical protein
MKRLFVIFYLLFLPVVAGAERFDINIFMNVINEVRDGCVENGRYKSEYTIDRRCYVTKEQKQQSPYNAVVALLHEKDSDIIWCTGTIVKMDDGYFLYTAKHCTDNNLDNRSDKVLQIKLQDGRTFDTSLVSQGNFDILHETNVFGDWAHYKMTVDKDDASIPYAKTDSFKDGKVKIVGYGNLGILSDEQIKQIKDAYVKYLIEAGWFGDDEESLKQAGYLTPDGGMIVGGILNSVIKRRLYNLDLKVSNCELSNGMLKRCQSWRGNSGGPLFNDNGEIMGILSQGRFQIGGARHGETGLVVGVYSDEKDNGKQRNWVASADDEEQVYYTNQKRDYERKEREAEEKMRQYAKTSAQIAIQENRQNRMESFYRNQQNKQTMIKMAGQYQ